MNYQRIVTSLTICFAAILTLPAAIAAEAIVFDHNCIDETDSKISASQLSKIRSLNVYFGHQSVGWNLLDGLDALADKTGNKYKLNIMQNPTLKFYKDTRGLGHGEIGENGNPNSKIQDFAAKITKAPAYGASLDAAMMKICFVDIESGTNVAQLFNTYKTTLESLAKKFPSMKVVYCTCPLVADGDNSKREQFNDLVRNYAKQSGKVLFDLADIESYSPQGKPCLRGSQKSLCKTYSEDREHPDSAAGKLRLARAWWSMMARISESSLGI
ncbi:MAG: SGNH/GDSL hydrolase family protein [Candidatus Obscuribacterales bacterium]|nr:SGNH/GDSL hydrolase family protein [Candidatus Obscuribacterales bacterium]